MKVKCEASYSQPNDFNTIPTEEDNQPLQLIKWLQELPPNAMLVNRDFHSGGLITAVWEEER